MITGLMRTHNCGELTSQETGDKATLCGWVNKYRNLGGLHFIDLRDKHGITQLNFSSFKGNLEMLKQCSLESTIKVTGLVQKRPAKDQNSKMATGEIELEVQELEMLSQCDVDNIPFLPFGATDATEDLKLRYRYLDLRTTRLQKIIQLKSDTTLKVRQALSEEGFVEVETPILYKTTPEGARDYIVPSRQHPGAVYALPQSPQTLKQLLMIGGTDKYFQICRCFRDEDLRADRQPEFTQIDLEVSFATPTYIKGVAEKILRAIFDLPKDFVVPTMPYQQAMDLYGTDKPDLRFDLQHQIVSDFFVDSSFKIFANAARSGGLVKAILLAREDGELSRKDLDHLNEVVKPHKGKGVAFCKSDGSDLSGGIAKFIDGPLREKLKAQAGTWLFVADEKEVVTHAAADALRRHLAQKLGLIGKENKFLWIDDFPLLEWNEEEKRFFARHHPFTKPKAKEGENWEQARAHAYDLVLNGHEIAGGSVRIHRLEEQQKMFEVLGISPQEAQDKFGFFLNALRFGVPPHAGMAFGLDRILMLLAGVDSIRDVIAFPKTTTATDLMAATPAPPAPEQLQELGISFKKS